MDSESQNKAYTFLKFPSQHFNFQIPAIVLAVSFPKWQFGFFLITFHKETYLHTYFLQKSPLFNVIKIKGTFFEWIHNIFQANARTFVIFTVKYIKLFPTHNCYKYSEYSNLRDVIPNTLTEWMRSGGGSVYITRKSDILR